jgi:choline kinase
MRAIILAAGKGSRWNKHLGIFKHFLKIDNETLIHRTVRLLLERNVTEIYVVGPNKEYEISHTKLYIPKLKKEYYDADKFLSSKDL